LREDLVRAVCRSTRPVAELAHRAPFGDDRPHRLIPLLSHAHIPHGRGVSRRCRSRCSEPAEGLSHSYRRRFGAYEPNLHTTLEPPTGIEPVTCCLQNSCSAN